MVNIVLKCTIFEIGAYRTDGNVDHSITYIPFHTISWGHNIFACDSSSS